MGKYFTITRSLKVNRETGKMRGHLKVFIGKVSCIVKFNLTVDVKEIEELPMLWSYRKNAHKKLQSDETLAFIEAIAFNGKKLRRVYVENAMGSIEGLTSNRLFHGKNSDELAHMKIRFIHIMDELMPVVDRKPFKSDSIDATIARKEKMEKELAPIRERNRAAKKAIRSKE